MSEQQTEQTHAKSPAIGIKDQYDGLRDGHVKGYACPKCDTTSITPIARCHCGGKPVVKDFASTGTVATYTIQKVAAEQFLNDTPFAWVVVQLDDGGPRLTGWIPYIARENELNIGDKVRLTTSYKPGFMFEKA